MSQRVLLGWGPIAPGLTRRDGAPTHAVIASDTRVEQAIEHGFQVEHADPTDPAALRELSVSVGGAIIAEADPERTLAIAEAADSVFDSVPIIAYTTQQTLDPAYKQALEAVTADIVQFQPSIADWIDQRLLDTEGHRAALLRRIITQINGELAVVTHDNPDPDALASATALVDIARGLGCPASVYYFGNINHQENRAMVNLLDLELTKLESSGPLADVGGIALVDHGRPGVNDGLPESTTVDIVIDHHPPRGLVDGAFVDLHSDVGATSTLLARYLDRLDVPLRPLTATALLYGIQVDTDHFVRGATERDFNAASLLLPQVDWDLLEQIESPTISSETFETIARAIDNRTEYGPVITSCVGELTDRDALAQAADRLLNLEGTTTTLVFGIQDGVVYCSGRARGSDIDLGETLRLAFDHIGSAGGHDNMAGAQIPVGMLVTDNEPDQAEIIARVITAEFLDTLKRATSIDDQFDPDRLAFCSPMSTTEE